MPDHGLERRGALTPPPRHPRRRPDSPAASIPGTAYRKSPGLEARNQPSPIPPPPPRPGSSASADLLRLHNRDGFCGCESFLRRVAVGATTASENLPHQRDRRDRANGTKSPANSSASLNGQSIGQQQRDAACQHGARAHGEPQYRQGYGHFFWRVHNNNGRSDTGSVSAVDSPHSGYKLSFPTVLSSFFGPTADRRFGGWDLIAAQLFDFWRTLLAGDGERGSRGYGILSTGGLAHGRSSHPALGTGVSGMRSGAHGSPATR